MKKIDFDPKKGIFEASIALSIFIWNYLLNISGFTLEKFVQFVNFGSSIQSILSLSFVLFLVFFALSIALICLAARSFKRNEAHLITIFSAIVGSALALAVFQSWGWAFPLLFFIGSIPLIIETTQTKLLELQRFQLFRSVWQASQKTVLLVTIGLFLSTAWLAGSNQAKNVQEFEKGFLDLAVNSTPASDNLNDQAATVFVNYQRQLLQQLTGTTQFQKLETKNDQDVREFVATMAALQIAVDTPEFKEQIKQQISQNSANSPKQLITIDLLKQQSPAIAEVFTFIETYYWLIAAVIAAGLFSFVGGIAIVPLSAILGWAIGQFTPERVEEAKATKTSQ